MSNPEKQNVRIALIQLECSERVDQNMQETVGRVREAAEKGAKIICLQELFRTQYFCQEEDSKSFLFAEKIPGSTTEQLSQLARELGVVIIAPVFEKRAEGLYHNSVAVIDADGTLLGIYRKTHIPDDPCFHEKFYFTPGDTGFKCFDTKAGRIGVLICWDQWFPEAARLTAMAGAQILFYPSAIGFQECDAEVSEKQAAAWETIQKGHSIANGVFTAAVNRVGKENAIQFWGRSFVCDPFGEILARASDNRPEVLTVDCDLSLIEETRQNWPFLRDRRVDAYKDLSRLFIDTDE